MPHLRIAALAALLAALAPARAAATPSRTAALEESPLFEDDTDLFLFPALTAFYARELTLHVGDGGPQGGFVAGEYWAVGAFYGARVAYDDLARTAANTGRDVLQPTRLVSLFLGRWAGDALVGASLTPSVGLRRLVGPRNSGVVSHAVAYEIEATVGYSARSETLHSDSAFSLGYHRFTSDEGGRALADTPALPSLALRNRTIFVGDGPMEWAFHGELAHRDESYAQRSPYTSVADLARWVLVLGGGPRIRPIEKLTVGASAELSWSGLRGTVDRARLGFGALTLPALQLAVEANPWQWFFVRAGITRRFHFVFLRPQTGTQADATLDAVSWSAGVGIERWGVQVDATLARGLLTNGPSLIGGGAPGLFGGLSARYHY